MIDRCVSFVKDGWDDCVVVIAFRLRFQNSFGAPQVEANTKGCINYWKTNEARFVKEGNEV